MYKLKRTNQKKFKTMNKTKNTMRQQRPRGRVPYPISNRATSLRKSFMIEILRGGWGSVVPWQPSPDGEETCNQDI